MVTVDSRVNDRQWDQATSVFTIVKGIVTQCDEHLQTAKITGTVCFTDQYTTVTKINTLHFHVHRDERRAVFLVGQYGGADVGSLGVL